MADDAIAKFLKRPVPKPKSVSVDEFLKTPVPAPEPAVPAPTPGFLENLKIGGQRALLSAADAGRVMEEALGAASRGDFAPIGQLIEQAGRGAAPFISGLSARPEMAGQAFLSEQTAQAPRVGEITAAREARMDADPTLFSREARAERARLDEMAGRDPSLAGKITRRTTEGVVTAIPSIVAGAATGGSVPAMATMAGIQSMNAPEMLVPNVALAATPLPLGKAIAPIVRRIKVGRVAVEAIPPAPVSIEPVAPGVIPEIPAISPETALPAAQTRAPFPATSPDVPLNPAQQEAAALNSAIRKLGTDSVDEIAEMIANANRRFNKTVSAPGQPKRSITPVERQSMREDYQRVSALTKEENAALAEVLPERTFSPVNKILVEGEPTARNISDIPIDEPSAQLDANLRQLKAFFGSRDIVQESRIAAAVGQSADDPAIVSSADLGLETVPVPVRPVDAVPVTRRISVDDISLGRETLSKGRIFQAQESLKGGVKPETKGVPLRQQVEPMTVVPDPQRPGKFIVEDDGNHRIALLKLQGVTDDIPVRSFETPTQTAEISATVGPRAGEVAPMEVEIGRQLRQAEASGVARNMDPLQVESMARAEQLPLLDVAQKSRLKKAFSIAADVYNIPRALLSSSDISAPFRQGAILTLPPSRWGKALRSSVEMFRALVPDRPTSIKGGIKAQFQPKTERFQRMIDAIASDPDAQAGQGAGLHLGTQSRGPLRKAEEEFVSRTADRIPIVRESQQAYTAYLDNIRLNTFKQYKQAIDAQGFTATQTERAYKAAADWINIATGRGSFGPKLDRAMDALNFFVFSPRLLASRIQVLNPRTYLKNATTAEGRVVLKKQMSEMAQFTGMVGGTLLLAKAAGFKVGTNPEKPDFLRLSLGNYHYDGLAGLQPVMRLIWNVGKDAVRASQGEKPQTGARDALDVGARFLRSKAAPVPSFFVDFFDRKTFEGKPFDLTDAAVERLTPIMWQDFIEAYQREGLGGPLMLSPGAVGFGVQYFEPKPIDAAIEARPGLLTELTRLQVRLADPRRKPDETDAAYKGRQQAIANLYSRFGVSLMSDRRYAKLPDTEKRDVFDVLHSRILDAVNTRDRSTGQFRFEALINSIRKSAKQKTIRERLISRRPPL